VIRRSGGSSRRCVDGGREADPGNGVFGALVCPGTTSLMHAVASCTRLTPVNTTGQSFIKD
jgi:hypothetical protein